MKITDIRIRSVESALDNSSKFKAVASITIDECFVIHDIKIIEGDDSAFIAMPSRKTKQGDYRDIVHPINTETRNYIQQEILSEYKKTGAV